MPMSRNPNRLPALASFGLPLLALAVWAGVVMLLAYQVRPTYPVSMDRSFDRHYLTDGWHQPEQSEQFPFRWMSGYATVKFPAIGRQPLKLVMHMGTSNVDPKPEKQVRVMARGALVAVFDVRNGVGRYEAPVAPELISRASGDLDLIVTTDSFQPPGDRRQLAIIMLGLAAEPTGFAGLILPPFFHSLYVAATGIFLYVILLLLGVSRRVSFGLSLGAILALALVYAFARPAVAFYADGLLLAVTLSLIALAVAQPVVTRLYRRVGMLDFNPRRGKGRVLFGLFAFGLLVAMSGVLYPQSEPHDFGFHLNRFKDVQAGNLFFENYVISGVGQGFYPPAMYVLLLPFGLLMRDPYNLVKLAPALFDFSVVFIIFYLARRYMSSYRHAAIMASALYVVLPINLLVIWWAHATNLFGMVMLLATVTYTLESYERISRPLVWLGLAALTFVLLLSHPGVLVWSVLLLSAMVVAFLALRRFARNGTYKSVLLIAGAYATAALIAFVFYYSRYVGRFGQAAVERGEEVEFSDTLGSVGDIGRLFNGLRLTFYHAVMGDYGLVPLLLVPVGFWLLFRRRGMVHPADEPESRLAANEQQAQRFRWTVLLWVAVAVTLQLISLLTALPVRPFLLLWVPVSLLAGLSLAAFIQPRHTEARQWTWQQGATALILASLAIFSLYLWALANFLDLRIPHVYPLVF
ncbi:MAG: hypothetical protein M3441_13210 [Chloroflexota bacterium]|nr:hypothetical protein [Chloroflexota bacterium]